MKGRHAASGGCSRFRCFGDSPCVRLGSLHIPFRESCIPAIAAVRNPWRSCAGSRLTFPAGRQSAEWPPCWHVRGVRPGAAPVERPDPGAAGAADQPAGVRRQSPVAARRRRQAHRHPARPRPRPEDAQVIDCGGCVVIPGLIDTHSHATLASVSQIVAMNPGHQVPAPDGGAGGRGDADARLHHRARRGRPGLRVEGRPRPGRGGGAANLSGGGDHLANLGAWGFPVAEQPADKARRSGRLRQLAGHVGACRRRPRGAVPYARTVDEARKPDQDHGGRRRGPAIRPFGILQFT